MGVRGVCVCVCVGAWRERSPVSPHGGCGAEGEARVLGRVGGRWGATSAVASDIQPGARPSSVPTVDHYDYN